MQFQKGIEMFNIYCDNAAQKHLTKSARKVIQTYLMNCHKWGNPSAIHSQGKSANREIESSRDTIANCINADRRGIFFTSGPGRKGRADLTSSPPSSHLTVAVSPECPASPDGSSPAAARANRCSGHIA